ncbi:MAG: hypothetical protein KDA41_09655 [Planctomycetales bacterium]|nr:hypothetical protein [Planctomycetales bacterium]
MRMRFTPGDWVVYRKTKYSTHPGPRAQNVNASQHGEKYSYTVDKFWIVSDVLEDGRVVLHTRRGKEHVVDADDPLLHRARWWERMLYRQRFISIGAECASDA